MREVGGDPEAVRLLVRFLRILRDCDQAEMATAAGIDHSSLSRYETGRTVPSRAVLEQLIATAGLPVSVVDSVLLPAIQAVRTARLLESTCEVRTELSPTSREAASVAAQAAQEDAFGETVRRAANAAVAAFLAEVEADDRPTG
jgi:transcriptional regulator with XRE-family HTH domain